VSDQFSLFDAPPVTDRLFFAIFPDAETAAGIARHAATLRASHQLSGRPLAPERFHVTLHHLGDHAGLPESLIAAASAAAAKLMTPPFEASFDCVASFAGHARRRPCVLRSQAEESNAPLFALQGALGDRLRAAGLGRYIERRFTPHVTLLYDERTLAPEAVIPIGWRVREFALIHSLLGKNEHRVLRRWSLPDNADE